MSPAPSPGLGLLLAGVAVGAGSVVMVQASRLRLLAAAPVIGRGFASTVVTQAVTGRDVLSPVVGNPVGTVSVVPGGLFDLLSEWVAGLMTRRGTAAVGQEGTA